MPLSPDSSNPLTGVMQSIMLRYHADMEAQVEHTLADLAGRWQGVRASLLTSITRLERQMQAAVKAGDTITYTWLAQQARLLDLKAAVAGDIAAYAKGARDIIGSAQGDAAELGLAAAQAKLDALTPPGINYTWGVPPRDVLDQIAGATQPYSPLYSLFEQMGAQAAANASAALFQSVALGEGPRAAARRLVWATDMSARRAEVIARTEIHRAWREAQFANYRANSDVVSSWMWSADFASERTCFPAGTRITTRRGALPIERVQIGDEVLTHEGRYRRVTETMRREYAGEMVTLETGSGGSVTTTADHAFLAFPDEHELRLDWIGAAYLCAGQTVAFYYAEMGVFNLATLSHLTTEKASLSVYNLEVADDHSYVANGFVVHNCGACIALDGSIHSLDEELADHVCGRCDAIPVTRPWSDILAGTGIPDDELAALDEGDASTWMDYRESGGEWLARQPADTQNRVLGPAKAEAWRQGAISLRDVAGITHDPTWGRSIEERSLKSLGLDAQRWLAEARSNGTAATTMSEEAQTALSEWEQQRAAAIAQARAAEAETAAARPSEWEQQRAAAIAGENATPLDMSVNPEVKFISQADVAAWAAENPEGLPSIGYHYATPTNLAQLEREGIDVTRASLRGYYGRGFYMFGGEQSAEDLKGMVIGKDLEAMQVAIHMKHPWMADYEQWQRLEDDIMADHPDWNRFSAEFAGEVTARLQAQGYDGAYIYDAEARAADAQIIAFEPGTVRIVNDARAAEEAQALAGSANDAAVSPVWQDIADALKQTPYSGPTAEYLAQADAYLAPRVAQYAALHPEMTLDEYKAAVTAKFQQLLADATPSVRVPSDVLDQILSDGRLKTSFEVGKFGEGVDSVAFYNNQRAAFEAGAFGYAADIPAELRPISGYLTDPGADNELAMHYGDARLILTADARNRVTATFADSLSYAGQMTPRSLGDMTWDAYNWPARTNTISPDMQAMYQLGLQSHDPLGWQTIADYSENTSYGYSGMYVEMQVHGGVSLSDIQEIVFTGQTAPDAALTARLDAQGISWSYAPTDNPLE